MLKKWLVVCGLLAGCSSPEQNAGPETGAASEVASDLEVPWSIEQSGSTFYISERPGTVAKIENGQVEHQQVELSDSLSGAAEAGLLGFVLKPDFPESQQAYAYYTYEKNGAPVNRVVELELTGSGWEETAILLDGVESGSVHHGGRLEISPDGQLFATIGDAGDPEKAQDPDALNGKIVQLGAGGSAEVYSLGHRNPQGMAWSENGQMYASEHGQSANDEINVIKEGSNYGWPEIEGNGTAAGMEAPFAVSGSRTTWAPSGMAWHKGSLYAAALRGEAVLKIDPATGEAREEITGYGRIRDVFSDGDHLYFITNNTDGRGTPSEGDDKLYRITN